MGDCRAPSWLTGRGAASLGAAAACALWLSLAALPGAAWAAPADSPASPEPDPAPGRAVNAPPTSAAEPRKTIRPANTRTPAGTAQRTTLAENATVPREPKARRSAVALPATVEHAEPISAPEALRSSAATIVTSGATPVAAAAPPAIAAAQTLRPAPAANAAAVPANPIADFINGVLLMVQRLFFNQAPTAAPVQAMTRRSGQVWGFVAGSDPEGDPLTYTLKQGPRFGTVTVSADGVYAYSPGADFTGTDTFTVAIADPGTPFALLNYLSGHTRDVMVSVKTSTGTPAGTVVDTFDGPADSAPDPALWGYHLGPFRDDGLQTYTDSVDNVRLDGQGNLVIQARPAADGYTSTRLVTQDRLEMQYGVIEARIKMPAGQGIWPAFWMLGTSYYPEHWERWPACGEIDIMEVVNTGTHYTVALHGPQGATDYYGGGDVPGRFVGNQGPISAVAPITDLTADYHDYWLMWRQDQIVIGVDNTMLGEFTPGSLPEGAEWVFNQKMYGILQIAVGGPWPGPPDATTPWPATMLVDSFRYTPLP